jgi:myo-inositol-1(or 4)-monophosphatase
MTALLDLFADAAAAAKAAIDALDVQQRRARTDRPGQYALDLAADAAALDVLHRAPVRVVSEESGSSGVPDAEVTVVLDPIDGSTNCARRLSYWATSLAAVDADGLLASYVVNHATGEATTARRGEGAWRDGVRIQASGVERVTDAVVAFGALPAERLPWKQARVLGCASLALCDVAAGHLDAYVDTAPHLSPWDYLGGLLALLEAGAVADDGTGAALVTTDATARRHLLVAATPSLLAAIRPAGGVR